MSQTASENAITGESFQHGEPASRRPPATIWSKEQEERLIRLYHTGMIHKGIALELGLSLYTVRYKINHLLNQGTLPHRMSPRGHRQHGCSIALKPATYHAIRRMAQQQKVYNRCIIEQLLNYWERYHP